MVQGVIHSRPGPTLKRRLLKGMYAQRINPAVLKLAGGRWSPWAKLRHVGRRSGRLYTTPVLATVVSDGLLIPLPFGPDTDWCRNLLAADRFSLRWHGHDYILEAPRVIETVVHEWQQGLGQRERPAAVRIRSAAACPRGASRPVM